MKKERAGFILTDLQFTVITEYIEKRQAINRGRFQSIDTRCL